MNNLSHTHYFPPFSAVNVCCLLFPLSIEVRERTINPFFFLLPLSLKGIENKNDNNHKTELLYMYKLLSRNRKELKNKWLVMLLDNKIQHDLVWSLNVLIMICYKYNLIKKHSSSYFIYVRIIISIYFKIELTNIYVFDYDRYTCMYIRYSLISLYGPF